MREMAQRADSEMAWSGEKAKRRNNAQILSPAGVPRTGFAFPSAMQALRTSPRHLARFMALPRKAALYSSSDSAASHSKLGRRRDCVMEPGIAPDRKDSPSVSLLSASGLREEEEKVLG